MKKITSFMFMVMLCCIGAYAQVATEYVNKLVKVGTAQAAMEPNTWYFLHNPRNPNQNADAHVMPGEIAPSAGGLVTDMGQSAGAKLTTTEVLGTMCSEEGISANDYMKNLVRFVPADEEGAFYVQYGTGNYMAKSPANGSVSNIQHMAGESGKYNFYLIKINGQENQAGRFAWNVYNMGDRVDNNGAGNGISLWSNGERVASEAESAEADGSLIKSNNVWQLYDIEVLGEVDLYESELDNVLATYLEITGREESSYIENLKENVNVGNSYGNYRPEDVAAFLELNDKIEKVMTDLDTTGDIEVVKAVFPTVEDLKKFHEDYKAADKKVRENKIPLAVNNIKNGYYTLDNILKWTETKKDTVYYTQEECDSVNKANNFTPDEVGFLTPDSVKEVLTSTVDAKVKALHSKNDDNGKPWLAWGEKKASSAFLWKIEKVEGSDTKYRLVNMYQGLTFNSVAGSANTPLIQDDTVAVYFDYRGEKEAPVVGGNHIVYSIRNTYNTSESGKQCYVHCGGHNSGAGKEGWTVGWYGDPEASLWYLTPVDEKTAEEWMESDVDKLNKMLAEADKIMKSAPGQLEIAKDILVTIDENDSIVTSYTQFKGFETIIDGKNVDPQDTEGFEAKTDPEETYEYLLDGDGRTYWHTSWTSNVAVHTHYLQIDATEPLDGSFAVKITRRAGADNDHATKLAVRGYDSDDANLTFDQGEDLGVLNIPFSAKGKVDFSTNSFDGKNKQYIRFYWEASNGTVQRGYWHAAEFNVFRATAGTVHETSQYAVRKAQATALETAMANWAKGEYNATNPELVNDPDFQAAYKALVDANKAWTAVYVDPTALRNAIKAAPAADLFVTGNNPGQWPVGAETPVATVDKAKKYDAACAYTPAESEQLIKDIQNATAKAFESANKVQPNKWYRFKFPTEEMYDKYGWDKVGADKKENELAGVTVGPALFGKTVAAAKAETTYVDFVNEEGEADTVATYQPVAADELVEGQYMYFFDDTDLAQFTNGEDLFRFIPATDSSYIIQNMATGLFLHGEHSANLSSVPTYFSTKAIGAGANIVSYTTVLGEKPNNHVNLHGQRDDNRLVCWEANKLGTNSMMMIEAVSDVNELPANTYTTKLWPGSVYTKVSPVDTKIMNGATAYGAELVVSEEDTTVVLKAIEAEVIKAGTPYVIVADATGDYQTPGDRKNEIIAEIIAEKGSYGYNEKALANERLDAEYARVEMEHGMAVDTIQKGLGHLVGTFRTLNVKAGKGLVTSANTFVHLTRNTNVDANRAYIACDFDPETTDILSGIVIKIEGSIDTGIEDALSNVAKSGNIYTVDGKLVGKGNINTVNNLPAGIYIVNGVKVIKK